MDPSPGIWFVLFRHHKRPSGSKESQDVFQNTMRAVGSYKTYELLATDQAALGHSAQVQTRGLPMFLDNSLFR